MLINSKAADERLTSGSNLINRLRAGREGSGRGGSLAIFGVGRTKEQPPAQENKLTFTIPTFEARTELIVSPPASQVASSDSSQSTNLQPATPTLDQLVPNANTELKLTQVHDKAVDVLHTAMDEVKRRLPEVQKVKDVAAIVAQMNKVVTDIRTDRNKKEKPDGDVHIHFYTPERRQLNDYPVIEVNLP